MKIFIVTFFIPLVLLYFLYVLIYHFVDLKTSTWYNRPNSGVSFGIMGISYLLFWWSSSAFSSNKLIVGYLTLIFAIVLYILTRAGESDNHSGEDLMLLKATIVYIAIDILLFTLIHCLVFFHWLIDFNNNFRLESPYRIDFKTANYIDLFIKYGCRCIEEVLFLQFIGYLITTFTRRSLKSSF